MTVDIDELLVADDPPAWETAGFAVRDATVLLGDLPVRLVGRNAGRGIVGWSLRGLRTPDLDGLPVSPVPAAAPRPPRPEPAPHPNGAVGLDHVVVFTPDRDRTAGALERAGLDLRRTVEGLGPQRPMRFAFFRLGAFVLEVAEPPDLVGRPERPARFWGLAVVVPDLDATAAALGDRLGAPRDAVQPGRRIATLRREAGLAVPVAFMTPRPAGGEDLTRALDA